MKRGSSGLSLVVAVNKPSGMSSHDVVNRCRKIFGERRVGHTGTLDPLATGVLPICVGPATRLDRYLTGHDKQYRVTMSFGFETTTDDIQGEPTVTGELLPDLLDGDFAYSYVEGLVGAHLQTPPQYSAIKVAGKKAYEVARAGGALDLEPRPIEVYEARLVDRNSDGDRLSWVIDVSVSKGTYIRALVRDMGRELGCPAHVAALERRQAGQLTLDDCVSLDTLETMSMRAAIDPVSLLRFRLAFGDDVEKKIESGSRLHAHDIALYEWAVQHSCTSSIAPSSVPLEDGELVSIVIANRLKAIYRYDGASMVLKPDCVFSTSVVRSSEA